MRVRDLAALIGLAFLIAAPPAARADNAPPANLIASGDFDYYVLALSWSPGFCDTGGEQKSPRQCAVGSGDGFVVHGLWPSNQRRPNPQDCDYGGDIPASTLQKTRGLFPDEGLARHEYGKHGTCTGFDAENYFAAVKYARDRIAIPDLLNAPRQRIATSPSEIESAFITINPNLTAANMAIACKGGELIDVRICISRDLAGFVDCPKVSGHTCHSSSIFVAPLR